VVLRRHLLVGPAEDTIHRELSKPRNYSTHTSHFSADDLRSAHGRHIFAKPNALPLLRLRALERKVELSSVEVLTRPRRESSGTSGGWRIERAKGPMPRVLLLSFVQCFHHLYFVIYLPQLFCICTHIATWDRTIRPSKRVLDSSEGRLSASLLPRRRTSEEMAEAASNPGNLTSTCCDLRQQLHTPLSDRNDELESIVHALRDKLTVFESGKSNLERERLESNATMLSLARGTTQALSWEHVTRIYAAWRNRVQNLSGMGSVGILTYSFE
jgi:hypothetical protein